MIEQHRGLEGDRVQSVERKLFNKAHKYFLRLDGGIDSMVSGANATALSQPELLVKWMSVFSEDRKIWPLEIENIQE